MDFILGIIKESYFLLSKMAIYLIFGFLFAGILHVFIKKNFIAKHLGKHNFTSVIKAALLGIPIPICSCGVIPAALSLRKEGASKSAVLSFLISTPTSGVDSILATYSLLGGFFTFFRVLASFIAGTFAGFLGTIFLNEEPIKAENNQEDCKLCENHTPETNHSILEKIQAVFHYAFVVLLKDIGKWLLIGTLIGGTISFLVPAQFINTHLSSGWQSMFLMLLVSIPMYVCATGSIPIAAALLLKGISPGAAFVFLLAGPATNSVTITVISKELGKKTTALYLISIIICSLGLGFILNQAWTFFDMKPLSQLIHNHASLIPSWLNNLSAILLLTLTCFHVFKPLFGKKKKCCEKH